MTNRVKKDIIKLIIDEVVINDEKLKISATIPLLNKIHEWEIVKTDLSGTFNAGATLDPINQTKMERIWTKHKQSFDMTQDKLNTTCGERSRTTLKPKVFVAMSGGVDSSVAAALLKKEGYKVTGVFMKPPSYARGYGGHSGLCMWERDREDAMRAASVLGIPFLTWDFSKEYKKEVGDYMIREYRAGRTPNPDVMCNKEIKFGLFLKKALKEGADFIATGHYMNIKKWQGDATGGLPGRAVPSTLGVSSGRTLPFFRLYQAKDKNKDQSYFLWTLTQKQLKNCLFPIGNYTKSEVRKLAKKFGLPNFDKKDSQGVCFIGTLDMKNFLKKFIKPKSGEIYLLQGALAKQGHLVGQAIGTHDGAYYYTIGQRHGLDIKNGRGPYYVTGKNIKKNIIYVGKEEDLSSKDTKIAYINWINPTWTFNVQVGGSIRVQVKIRYRSESTPAVIDFPYSKQDKKYTICNIHFSKPVRAITPGQSAVFYCGEEMLGGGIIN